MSRAISQSWYLISDNATPPRTNAAVIVSAKWDGHDYTTVGYYYEGKFYREPSYSSAFKKDKNALLFEEVIAWMNFPEPVKL